MVMTLDAVQAEVTGWYTPILGTFPDPDGAYGPQCKDLISHYIDVVHGEPYTVGNGIDMARNLISQRGWTPISASARWQAGDVVSTNWGGTYGHVYVVIEDYGTTVKMVDLNGGPLPAGSGPDEAVKVRTVSRTGVVGVARPPRYVGATATATTPDPAPAPALTPTQILSGQGTLPADLVLFNAAALVKAATEAGVPLHIAAAFVHQESAGKNVYGHDYGGIFSTNPNAVTLLGKTYPVGSNIAVTPQNYAAFLGLLLNPDGTWTGRTSNGVGPLQATYWAYFRDARNAGIDLSDPYQNILFGLRVIIKDSGLGTDYSEANVKLAATRYNRGPSATVVTQYGLDVWKKAEQYRLALAGAATGGTTPAPTEPTTPTDPIAPPMPGVPVTNDPGALPQDLQSSTVTAVALPDPAPGAVHVDVPVSAPVARIRFRGTAWSPLAVSIRRSLQIPGPDQSPIGAPIIAATGEITLARPVPLSDRGWSLWHDDPPRDGEPIVLEVSDDDWLTWTTKFVGTVRGVTAEITDRGIVVEVTDLSRRLVARFSNPPLNFRQPSPVNGYPYMRIGLHPVYYADRAARAGRFYCTPPMPSTALVSVPMVGSMWPERGTIISSATLNAKGGTEGVPGDSPEYRRTPWGLSVHNVFSIVTPVLTGDAGYLTTPHAIRALVGPATDTISAVELWWDRVSITAMVTRSAVTVEVQTGWNADGTRVVMHRRTAPVSVAEAAAGFELRVRLSPSDGRIEIEVGDSRTVHAAIPAWPLEATSTPLSQVRILAPAAGAPLGGVQVMTDPDGTAMAPWTRTFFPDVDPDHMLWGGPAMVDVRGLDVLTEMAEAALDTVWVDEVGHLHYVSRARMDARSSVRTLALPELATAPARMTPDSVFSEVQVKRQQPSLFQTRMNSRAWHQVWEGSRDTLEPGGTWDQVVNVPDDEDWFHVDGSFEDVTAASVANTNRGIGSWVGGTTIVEGEDGPVEGVAPQSWFVAEAWRINYRSYGVQARYRPPEGVTANLSLSVPELPYLHKRRVGNGPIMRARGKQVWAEADPVTIQTGAVMDDPTPYVHDGGRWVQSGLQARRIARRLAPMFAQPIPAWGPVRVGRPDLSLRLADTLTLELYGTDRPQRLAGETLDFTPDTGLVQTLTLRQLRP